MSIGPALPPGFLASKEVDEEEKQAYCPALPPGFSVTKNVDKQSDPLPDIPDKVVGPANMTNTEEDSSDDDFVGPSLELAAPADAQYDAAEEFAARNRSWEAEKKRAEEEKLAQTKGREDWMMSLPSVGLAQDIGLTARTFRTKAAPQQDSSWTKAPGDIEKEVNNSKEPTKRSYDNSNLRDQEISERLENYNDSKRQKSLVEMHTKKLKKEKKKEKEKNGGAAERVPFSRETDMQVNRFDEAQRKSIMKKAAQLDSRFGHGSQKYE